MSKLKKRMSTFTLSEKSQHILTMLSDSSGMSKSMIVDFLIQGKGKIDDNLLVVSSHVECDK